MYQPGTILELKEPRSTADKLFAYDEVEVIGQSPVNHAIHSGGEWAGSNGQGVLITPLTDFAGVSDEPLGKLQEIYKVKSVPERIIAAPTVRVVNSASAEAGKTPEELFKDESPKQPKVRPAKKPVSPL